MPEHVAEAADASEFLLGRDGAPAFRANSDAGFGDALKATLYSGEAERISKEGRDV